MNNFIKGDYTLWDARFHFRGTLTKKIDDAIEEGKEMKADGYVYENYELTQKEVK